MLLRGFYSCIHLFVHWGTSKTKLNLKADEVDFGICSPTGLQKVPDLGVVHWPGLSQVTQDCFWSSWEVKGALLM